MARYINASETEIEHDGVQFPVGSRFHADLTARGVEIAAFQRWADLAAAKAGLGAEVEAIASAMRVAVAGTADAGKLSVYQRKYDTAVRALANDAGAIAALTPEADARGETVAQLATLVKSLGDAWTAACLAIDAAYQAHKAAIAGLANVAAAQAYDTGAGWPG